MDYLVGIDLGSTSLKAMVYDVEGRLAASGSRPTILDSSNPDHPEWAVWRPEQIWGGAAEALWDAVQQLDDPAQIKGVAVTGMGMDGLPLDEKGNWLYPFMSWHDPRTTPQFEWWQEHIGAAKTFSVGGNTLWNFSTALRILWMREHEPEILARTHKWVLLEDFLNYQLCGQLATDYSMASCTLLFDQRTRDWSEEMLGMAGIDRALWCDAHPSGTVLGEVHEDAAKATGLPVGTPVVLGGHDYLCGALPVGAFKPGLILDMTGTWEIVLGATPQPILTPELQRAGMTVEAHVARDTYAAWGGAVAADMLEWYRREYGHGAAQKAEAEGGSDWDYLMAEAAAAKAGAGGVLFLPHMSGAGCPVVDPISRGAFVGLRDRSTRGDMLRAIIEGLDYQFLDIVKTMESSLGESIGQFVAVGGAIRNTFWMQNKADIVGRPIQVPDIEEATPLGAAILAGIGTGLYKDEQDAFDHVYRPGKTFEPDAAAHAIYEQGFQTYKGLHAALRNVHQELAAHRG